jgi:hypothetical protein
VSRLLDDNKCSASHFGERRSEDLGFVMLVWLSGIQICWSNEDHEKTFTTGIADLPGGRSNLLVAEVLSGQSQIEHEHRALMSVELPDSSVRCLTLFGRRRGREREAKQSCCDVGFARC